jgi:exopolysaccharide biosynthesis polyprenyl glycosylphosphotransferase
LEGFTRSVVRLVQESGLKREHSEPVLETEVEEVGTKVAARLHRLAAPPAFHLVPGVEVQIAWTVADGLTTFLLALAAQGLSLGALHVEAAAAIAAVMVCTLSALGAYRRLEGPCRIETVTAIVQGSFFSVAVLLALGALFGRGALTFSLLLTLPLLVGGLIAQRILTRMVEGHFGPRLQKSVIVYGAGPTGMLLAQKLLEERDLGFRPIGFIDDDVSLKGKQLRVGAGEHGEKLTVIGCGSDLREMLKQTLPGAVFLTSTTPRQISELEAEAESLGVPLYFVPSVGDHTLSALRVSTLGGIPVLTRRKPVQDRAYAAVKRFFDFAGAALLLVLTAPIFIVSALLVRFTSEGPVIFTQRRVGLNGQLFTIYKLRTMFVTAPRYGFHPDQASDGRVTPVGRWLRRLSLDELPQLFNILKGDMSFVGPRPEMPFIVANYNDVELQRLTVKPGLTGLWQISADRAFKIHENIHYDLYYVENRSLLVDLSIFLLTPFVLLAGHRAK